MSYLYFIVVTSIGVNSVGVNGDAIDEVSKSECEYKLRRHSTLRHTHIHMCVRPSVNLAQDLIARIVPRTREEISKKFVYLASKALITCCSTSLGHRLFDKTTTINIELQTRQFIKRKSENEIASLAPITLPCSRKLGIDFVNENFYSSREPRGYTIFIVRP